MKAINLDRGKVLRALAGLPIQARTPVKPTHKIPRARTLMWVNQDAVELMHSFRCPLGVPGDILRGRESFQWVWSDPDDRPYSTKDPRGWNIGYVATDGVQDLYDEEKGLTTARAPASHMPEWASRIFLRIKSVRVERLQEIKRADVIAEGIDVGHLEKNDKFFHRDDVPFITMREFWNASAAGKRFPAESNPWVWVPELEPITKAEAMKSVE